MNIQKIRNSRNINQIELAERCKLAQPTISRAERGDDGTTLGVFKSIAAALDVQLHDLFIPDRSQAEAELLAAFRRLPEDRQRGWLDMARLAAQDQPEPTQ
jgi:transcriptional regulator with XRE-family HTH domain